MHKVAIKSEQEIYDNTEASVLYYRCRANCLNLNERKRFINAETKCVMCDHHLEDLEHFLLHCEGYKNIRTYSTTLQQPYPEDKKQIIGNLLFNKNIAENTKEIIHKFWKVRSKKLKEEQQQN